jgi:hypothetical protein
VNRFYIREEDDMRTEQEQINSDFDDASNFGRGVAFVISLAFLLVVLAWCATANAQTLTFSATPPTAVSRATPALTLDVTGLGGRTATCTASGGWTGPQVPGTSTQPEIAATTTYTIACSAPAIAQVTTAQLVWQAPTLNTDGTAYANAKGFMVYGAQTQAGLATATGRAVNNPAATSVTYTGINQPGTWWFCVKAVNLADLLSGCSNAASKTIAPGVPAWSDTKSVTVTITAPPVPNPPSNLVITDVIAFNVENGVGTRVAMTPVRSTCEGDECTVVARVEQ